MENEDEKILAARGPVHKGVLVLKTDGHRAIGTLVNDLISRGFHLSGVRTFAKRTGGFLVRCAFAKEGNVASPVLMATLNVLCSTTVWLARAYRNMALSNGIVIEDLSDVSVALASPRKIRSDHRPPLSLDTAFF